MARRWFCLSGTLVLVLVCAGCANTSVPTSIRVVPVLAADCPQISPKRMDGVLAKAKSIIKDVCKLNVEFVVDATRQADAFLDEHRQRIAPYTPARFAWDIYQTPFEEYQKAAFNHCADSRKLPVISSWLADSKDARSVAGEGSAAAMMLDAYFQGMEQFAALKNPIGQPLVTKENWQRYSVTYWGIYLHSAPWTPSRTLYLTNLPLIDDFRGFQSIVSLARPMANGMVLPASRTVYSTYYWAMHGEPAGGNPRLKQLTDDERDDAMAYAIAQQVGVWLLLGRGHSYGDDGGLARPLPIVPDKRDFQSTGRMKLQKNQTATNDEDRSYVFKVLLRMDVLAAQEKWDQVLEEGQRAGEGPFERKGDLEQVQSRIENARTQLEAR